MDDAREDRTQAAQLPEGDVIRTLLEQHARIRDLFEEVSRSTGDQRQRAFDELRALLAVHETAEEMILRPISREAAGEVVVEARNEEEHQATEVLEQLEKLDVDSEEFAAQLLTLQRAVTQHAENEETEEFPHVLATCDEDQRRVMGTALRAAEAVAPTHPHASTAGSPAAQWAVGPFASMLDRARDLIGKATG
jgi:hemerythrin superfamily protein